MKQKEAGIYRSEHFHSAGSVHFLTGVDTVLFILLGSVDVRFDMTIRGILNVVLISLSSFFDFGYFRIYEAFLHSYPKSFFTDEERIQIESSGKIRPDFWAHFMPGALYVILSTLMMLIAIYY